MSGAADPLLGKIVGDRYVVRRGPLGETGEADAGGWSDVYLAVDRRMHDRRVVLKFPKRALLAGEEGAQFRARFQREIAMLLASSENCPGIVPILDAGQYAGRPYCVFKYIDGGSLEGRLARQESGADRPPRRVAVRQTPAEVAAWLPAVATAIDTVHRRGIVHRDVKPANILFGADGTPYLSDFGIARFAASDETTRGLTATKARNAFYTAGYESPEFIEGLPADFAYDRYALAVVVFRALTGRLPHWSTDPRVEDRHRALASRRTRDAAEDVRSLAPHVSARVAAVVAKALSREPAARYLDGQAFATAFVAAAGGGGTAAPVDAAATVDPTRRAPPPAATAQPDPVADDASADGRRRAGASTPTADAVTSNVRRVAPWARGLALAIAAAAAVGSAVALATGVFSGTGRSPPDAARAPTPAPASPAPSSPAASGRTDGDALPTPPPPTEAASIPKAPEVPEGSTPLETPAPSPVAPAMTDAPPPPARGNADVAKPAWAKTSPEQDAYAAKVGVPVWHETDLGGGQALRFVLIPPGTFTMGSPATEVGRAADEQEHEVELTHAFYASIGEVTNAQYRRSQTTRHSETGLDADDQPVVGVSHREATEFAAWLSGRDRWRTYRLPTEAEWEYACRAGTRTPFAYGASITSAQANYDGRSAYGGGATGPVRRATTPLGTFPPNRWGLYDVHGNAWEWCADWYGSYPTGPAKDPQGPPSGSARVQRGGAWGLGPERVRSAKRGQATAFLPESTDGFRLVMIGVLQ